MGLVTKQAGKVGIHRDKAGQLVFSLAVSPEVETYLKGLAGGQLVRTARTYQQAVTFAPHMMCVAEGEGRHSEQAWAATSGAAKDRVCLWKMSDSDNQKKFDRNRDGQGYVVSYHNTDLPLYEDGQANMALLFVWGASQPGGVRITLDAGLLTDVEAKDWVKLAQNRLQNLGRLAYALTAFSVTGCVNVVVEESESAFVN